MKSRVLVPEDFGRWLALEEGKLLWYRQRARESFSRISLTLGHIARSITFMQSPPMLAWTPYHTLKIIQTWKIMGRRDLPSHCTAIEGTPQAPIQPKARSIYNGESHMENGTRACIEDDEGCDDAIANPHTYPCLPPREPKLNHRRYNHPSLFVIFSFQGQGMSCETYELTLKLSAIQLVWSREN